MKLAWLTDLHLNFLGAEGVEAFVSSLAATEADAFLIGGDTGEAHDVLRYLGLLDAALRRPVYFVLGNHDFYRGTIDGVRTMVEALCIDSPTLHWLPCSGVVP